ncbi:ATP synthase F1 subunit epsilon [Candidatus Trichorickettsia mobilis]|uniref:ATP synthase F1 subunit epsilon n=1 Tax=Candidatus Trichorickettsia mobilis TaxID=1346319 RepID=UPI00292D7760|nr:ATP synthase F1 subunit epsilon [Candidatus Trichorickettsia mobilis]
MDKKATILVNIVTPTSLLVSCQASMVIIPGEEGEFGVLPRHMLLISNLSAGIVKITKNGDILRYFVDGGIAQVTETAVNILTEFSVNLAVEQKNIIIEKINNYKAELEKANDQLYMDLICSNIARYEAMLRYIRQ